jgi:hypothetical protein
MARNDWMTLETPTLPRNSRSPVTCVLGQRDNGAIGDQYLREFAVISRGAEVIQVSAQPPPRWRTPIQLGHAAANCHSAGSELVVGRSTAPIRWSGRWDSNPRSRAPKARALPTTPHPGPADHTTSEAREPPVALASSWTRRRSGWQAERSARRHDKGHMETPVTVARAADRPIDVLLDSPADGGARPAVRTNPHGSFERTCTHVGCGQRVTMPAPIAALPGLPAVDGPPARRRGADPPRWPRTMPAG